MTEQSSPRGRVSLPVKIGSNGHRPHVIGWLLTESLTRLHGMHRKQVGEVGERNSSARSSEKTKLTKGDRQASLESLDRRDSGWRRRSVTIAAVRPRVRDVGADSVMLGCESRVGSSDCMRQRFDESAETRRARIGVNGVCARRRGSEYGITVERRPTIEHPRACLKHDCEIGYR